MVCNIIFLCVLVYLSLQGSAVDDTGIQTTNKLLEISQGGSFLEFETVTDDLQSEEIIAEIEGEPVIDLDEVFDNSTLADDRRNLLKPVCKFLKTSGSDAQKKIDIKSVEIAGESGTYYCAHDRNAQFRTKGKNFKVRVEIEDNDDICPGCHEQVHVGLMDDFGTLVWNEGWSQINYECVNLGSYHFGHKTLNFEFNVRSHQHVSVFMMVTLNYRCRGMDCRGMEDIGMLTYHLPRTGHQEKVARIFIE